MGLPSRLAVRLHALVAAPPPLLERDGGSPCGKRGLVLAFAQKTVLAGPAESARRRTGPEARDGNQPPPWSPPRLHFCRRPSPISPPRLSLRRPPRRARPIYSSTPVRSWCPYLIAVCPGLVPKIPSGPCVTTFIAAAVVRSPYTRAPSCAPWPRPRARPSSFARGRRP